MGAGFLPSGSKDDGDLGRGLRKGDWIFAYSQPGVVAAYGRLEGWAEKNRTYLIMQPSRYTLTPTGYIKRSREIPMHVDVAQNMTFSISDEHETAAYEKERPWVKLLEMPIQTRLDGAPLSGRVTRVFDDSVTFNPWILVDYHGVTPYQLIEKDLKASMHQLGAPKPHYRSLEEMVKILNAQSIRQPDGECPLQFQCPHLQTRETPAPYAHSNAEPPLSIVEPARPQTDNLVVSIREVQSRYSSD